MDGRYFSVFALFLFSVSASAQVFLATDVIRDPQGANLITIETPDSAFLEDRGTLVQQNREASRLILSQASQIDYFYSRILNALNHSQILYPQPGYDFQGCKNDILAFVLTHQRYRIYVCAASFVRFPTYWMGQVFIHESAHVAGYGDECDATRIEVGAMRASGRDIFFRNGYMDRCGITSP